MRAVHPLAFNPTLQFRYVVLTTKLPMALFYARSADQPSFDNNPIEIAHGNGSFFIKGKTKWNDINLRCYQFEGITVGQVWKYFQQHQLVRDAKDFYTDFYKHDMQLTILNPLEIPIGTWALRGSFFTSVNFGQMDWGGEEITTIDIGIKYDFAEYRNFI